MTRAETNPGYDSTLEVLASIPKSPRYALLTDLAADFGFATQASVRAHLRRLAMEWDIKVSTYRTAGGGSGASLSELEWPAAKQASETYWRDVYSE